MVTGCCVGVPEPCSDFAPELLEKENNTQSQKFSQIHIPSVLNYMGRTMSIFTYAAVCAGGNWISELNSTC